MRKATCLDCMKKMNIQMTKEDIEKAAVDSCVIENDIFNPQLTPYYEQGFKDGANWRINSVWNDSSITPDPMQECLILLNDPMRKGFHIGRIENQGTNNGKWNIYGYFTPSLHEFVIRWAYIEDLLPNKENLSCAI